MDFTGLPFAFFGGKMYSSSCNRLDQYLIFSIAFDLPTPLSFAKYNS